MIITRKTKIETDEIQVGDQIYVGKYTATCQAIPGEGLALFLLDQYLDIPTPWNKTNTTEGGYAKSYVRQRLNRKEILEIFDGLKLVPHENGDLLRLPFYGEMFGHDRYYFSADIEPDEAEQWPLMKDRKNRIALQEGDGYPWGWLQNVRSAASAAGVYSYGFANNDGASYAGYLRPAFIVKLS